MDFSYDLTASRREINKYLFLTLLISPLLALVIAIFYFKNRVARRVIFAILVLYGLTMVYAGDSTREAEKFIFWSGKTIEDLLSYFQNLYISAKNIDFIQEVLMFLVSRLTGNPAIYYGVVATIFAFFYLKSIEHIYNAHLPSANINSLIPFWFFIMFLPVFTISGSRWVLAAWILFYALYLYFMHRELKYIFLSLSTIFIHFSFIGPVLAFIVFLILGRRNIIYYILIVASFFVQPLTASYINKVETNSFEGVQERIETYTNEDTMETRHISYENVRWIVKNQGKMLAIYLPLGIFYARRRFRTVSSILLLEQLYSFCLLLYALANSFLKIPSGGRFQSIFFMFSTLYLIILFARVQPKSLSRLTIIGLLPMFLYVIVELRRGLDTLNMALAFPLPLAFFQKFTLL